MIVLDMKWFLLLMMGLLVHSTQAQDKWIVHVNKKAVLEANEESVEKNQVRVKAADLKKANNFVLTYFENPKQKGWTRSIMIFDSMDKELKRIKGTKLSLTNSNLLSLLKKHKSIQLYTWSIPDDPALKARIRVRRVHLCTLVLE
jgi:hypothetical protein